MGKFVKDLCFPLPFNSQMWLSCNFSLQNWYDIQPTSNENNQTYQVEVVILIWHQIFVTYLQGNI